MMIFTVQPTAHKYSMRDEMQYLLDKISSADFQNDPYPHLEIRDFFNDRDLESLLTDPQIAIPAQESTRDLIAELTQQGYQACAFSGTTDDAELYLDCLDNNQWPVDPRRAQRLGMVFRLPSPRLDHTRQLLEFLRGHDFLSTLLKKFQIPDRSVDCTFALQKYLHGYEISPHPDNRNKKLTFLLNINTDPLADKLDIHTHLLAFRPEKRFIAEFWKHNPQYNRDMVPWEWTETKKIVNTNNTLLVFSPSDITLHGVKLDYDHLRFQRTQIYGNVFDSEITYGPTSNKQNKKRLPYVKYTEFDIQADPETLEHWYPMDTRLDFDREGKIFKTI